MNLIGDNNAIPGLHRLYWPSKLSVKPNSICHARLEFERISTPVFNRYIAFEYVCNQSILESLEIGQ